MQCRSRVSVIRCGKTPGFHYFQDRPFAVDGKDHGTSNRLPVAFHLQAQFRPVPPVAWFHGGNEVSAMQQLQRNHANLGVHEEEHLDRGPEPIQPGYLLSAMSG